VFSGERERFEHLIRAARKNCLEFSGGDSGIQTPDLRIMIADAVKTGFHFLRGAALASTNCTRSVRQHCSFLCLTVRNMRVAIIR